MSGFKVAPTNSRNASRGLPKVEPLLAIADRRLSLSLWPSSSSERSPSTRQNSASRISSFIEPVTERFSAFANQVDPCLLCSVIGVAIAKMDVNIFVQIGFVVLVGLAAKNAILIVEFAKEKRAEGVPAFDAAVEACRLRLRQILMTSFAFILGVVPLVVAAGAGAEMRRALGVAVFSGMLGVTVFGIFLTPVFYYLMERLGGSSVSKVDAKAAHGTAVPAAHPNGEAVHPIPRDHA